MKTIPPMAYIPMDLLINADWRMRMSERAQEIAEFVTVEDALLLYLNL